MKTLRITALTIAVLAAFPAAAQSHAEVLAELRALKAKVAELETQLKAQAEKTPPAGAQWGMTPDQARELNRITVKTEAMEDARDASGLKMLKIGGYADQTCI